MEEKNKQTNQQKSKETIQLSDIILESDKYCVAQLADILIHLLNQESIKDYLGITQIRKLNKESSYCG